MGTLPYPAVLSAWGKEGPLVFRLQGCRSWGHEEHALALLALWAWGDSLIG